ncbi:DUF1992 domain-containing protein [Nocardioides sp. KIGAM211]|uniref:DUF1992 domain-containing protein n=1 Tax=Nocardioides luti TaxID=2761101 RepID=A0A7X0RHA3_9ACTN|nr:DUF1992 domain-containing protein [Nocardioides luti]MBB6628306.1 DUF1992 domain-containing protein [Nocardioides luti]
MPDSSKRPEDPADRPDRVDRVNPARDTDARTGRSAAAARIQNQTSWVDQQIRVSMAKGDFDDLPGYGKPIEGLGGQHDPDWWLKKLVERESIAVLPPSLQLRKDDAELDAKLDRLGSAAEARREVEDFNDRVIRARYLLPEGPPLITMPRDVDATLAAWAERRTERTAAARERARQLRAEQAAEPARPRKRWFRRG